MNVVLAQLLNERGIVSVPEQMMSLPLHGRRMPDVLVVFQGLRTVIEGKVDDHPEAGKQALGDASSRVEEGIAHIGIAVLYPEALRHVPSLDSLRQHLSSTTLRINICSEAGQHGWNECSVDDIGDLLRRTFEQLVEEDVVVRAVAALEAGVARFAQAISWAPAVVERSAKVLGIGEPDKKEDLE